MMLQKMPEMCQVEASIRSTKKKESQTHRLMRVSFYDCFHLWAFIQAYHRSMENNLSFLCASK